MRVSQSGNVTTDYYLLWLRLPFMFRSLFQVSCYMQPLWFSTYTNEPNEIFSFWFNCKWKKKTRASSFCSLLRADEERRERRYAAGLFIYCRTGRFSLFSTYFVGEKREKRHRGQVEGYLWRFSHFEPAGLEMRTPYKEHIMGRWKKR